MTEYKDWQISIPFDVPKDDTEGDWTDALLEAAIECASDNVAGIVARGDTAMGRVWITFKVLDSSRDIADEIAQGMQERISVKVLTGGEASIV